MFKIGYSSKICRYGSIFGKMGFNAGLHTPVTFLVFSFDFILVGYGELVPI